MRTGEGWEERCSQSVHTSSTAVREGSITRSSWWRVMVRAPQCPRDTFDAIRLFYRSVNQDPSKAFHGIPSDGLQIKVPWSVVGSVSVKMSGTCSCLTWFKRDTEKIRISTSHTSSKSTSVVASIFERLQLLVSGIVEDCVRMAMLGFILLG